VGAVNTMSNGLPYGVRRTLPSSLGLQLGYGLQIAVVGIGLGALLASSSLAFEIVKWVGVLYLVWWGYKKWTQPLLSLVTSIKRHESVKKQFWTAAFVYLTNPKATVFLLALFPQFIDVGADTQLVQTAVMGGTLIMADIIVMVGYASMTSQLSHWMKSERHQVIQNRIFGGMFIGAATLMAGYRNS
jgi:homoserine/homoserine lactone efflux protein